jgi:predicted Rossmann fold flavoprotein
MTNPSTTPESGAAARRGAIDLAIVGAGAAGMAAAIFAGEAARELAEGRRWPRIVLLDGAARPGAKILVSGGGRCNLTNDTTTPDDFFGGPRTIIRKVLRAFDADATRSWMERLGVELKREEDGKWFPVSDSARTVLNALTDRIGELGIELRAGARVDDVRPVDLAGSLTASTDGVGAGDAAGAGESGWEIALSSGERLQARRVILATGGLALPKSGSDGHGLRIARALGHTIVPTTPALVPLVLSAAARYTPAGQFADWSGVAVLARLRLASPTGKLLDERVGPILFTHFGVSGPAPLDISRHWLRYRLDHPDEPSPRLTVDLGNHPSVAAADEWLREESLEHPRRAPVASLRFLPERIARALAPDTVPFSQLGRERRLTLAEHLAALPLPVAGDRGYTFAETTAGGVDLREIDAATMASRVAPPGLHLVGEMLDVDGRLGGFNFQWAWASGHVAGRAAVRAILAADAGG